MRAGSGISGSLVLTTRYPTSTIAEMMNVTSPNDWLRFGMGGHNIEANSILYYTINQGIVLGEVVGEKQSILGRLGHRRQKASKLLQNRLLWNETAGM